MATFEERLAALEKQMAKVTDELGESYTLSKTGQQTDQILGGAVRYDEAQSLTDAQKDQARTNINAAPGGFGLGANGHPYAYTVLTADTIDSVNRSGLYVYDDNNISIDTGLGNYGGGGLLLHLAHTIAHSHDAKQIFYPRAGMKNTYLERVKDADKGWQPWEYVNPPMALGVEYRTTERYLGKPVYVKLIDCGNLPDGTTKEVAHGITNLDFIVGAQAIASNSSSGFNGHTYLPTIYNGSLTDRWTNYLAGVDTNNIRIFCGGGLAGCPVYVTFKYTKTTD